MHTLRSRGSIPGPVGPTRRKRYRDPITGGGGERPTVVIANRLVETPVYADYAGSPVMILQRIFFD